jgi:hypothetical protein
MRWLCLVALAGCFLPHNAAGRHRALVQNAWVAVGGLAMAALGYGGLRSLSGDDAPPEPVVAGGAVMIISGAAMTLGGLAGAGATELGLTSVQ